MLIRVCECCEKTIFIDSFSIVEGRIVNDFRSSTKFKIELCTECLEKVGEFISDLKTMESESDDISSEGIKHMKWGTKNDE